MAQRTVEGRTFRCLVCAARVGQLLPFCEWCGAKHAFAGGELVLTGAICQECGFQAPVPFSRCPQCRAQRRLLCPACSTALAVRQSCAHCGLHFMFFDKVRREHSRANRHPRVMRMSVATRKLVFIALVVAVGLPLCMGHDARWFALGLVSSLIVALALGSGTIRLPGIRRRKRVDQDLVTVLETYDLAEAVSARAWLRLSGIEAVTLAVQAKGAVSSPPGGLRRIMVARLDVARAAGCLTEHGFDLAGCVRGAHNQPPRWGLHLVHSGSARGANRGKKRDHD
ncbi:MAG TPA: hypothetical protein VKB84_15775 [Candidatus Binataceae bacterium]|nr:hypothetical protein [Candidatus Binataceae bacterium]